MRRPRRAPRRIRKLSHPRWTKRKIHAATVWCEPSLIRGEVLLGFNKLPDTDGKKTLDGPARKVHIGSPLDPLQLHVKEQRRVAVGVLDDRLERAQLHEADGETNGST